MEFKKEDLNHFCTKPLNVKNFNQYYIYLSFYKSIITQENYITSCLKR